MEVARPRETGDLRRVEVAGTKTNQMDRMIVHQAARNQQAATPRLVAACSSQ